MITSQHISIVFLILAIWTTLALFTGIAGMLKEGGEAHWYNFAIPSTLWGAFVLFMWVL